MPVIVATSAICFTVFLKKYVKKKVYLLKYCKPLILETAQKIKLASPSLTQTGPAKRGDFETIAKHLILLENDEEKRNL